MDESHFTVDFGSGVRGCYVGWDPDLELNPQLRRLDHLLPVEKAGIILRHPRQDGEGTCESVVHFDIPGLEGELGSPVWQVQCWVPLTVTPSILCSPDKGGCGLHGYITEGRWVSC